MGVAVVQTGFLDNLAAVFQHINLPFHFQLDGPFHKTEGVQVFGFGAGAQWSAGFADGHVHIETHVALGHVAIADADGGDNCMEFACKGYGFFRIGHVRFRDHFDQRCAGPVQVNPGHAVEVFMQGFPGVFFQVRMVNAHGFFLTVFQLDFYLAGTHDGLGQLGGLIAFRKIRIKIIFPFKHTVTADICVDGQTK